MNAIVLWYPPAERMLKIGSTIAQATHAVIFHNRDTLLNPVAGDRTKESITSIGRFEAESLTERATQVRSSVTEDGVPTCDGRLSYPSTSKEKQ